MASKKKVPKKVKLNFFKKVTDKLSVSKPKLAFSVMLLVLLLSTVIYSANYGLQYRQASSMYKKAQAGWFRINLPHDVVAMVCRTPPNQGGSQVHAMVGKTFADYRRVTLSSSPGGDRGVNGFFNLGGYGYWGWTDWTGPAPLYGGSYWLSVALSSQGYASQQSAIFRIIDLPIC